MKRPFKIREAFVLQHEERFDAFMLNQDFEFFEVKLESSEELCIQRKDPLRLGNLYRRSQPVSIYLTKQKRGGDTILIQENKWRVDVFIITLFMSVIFFLCGYSAIVERSIRTTGLGLLISSVSIFAFNGFCFIEEKNLAKHLKMVLMNNDFIAINA